MGMAMVRWLVVACCVVVVVVATPSTSSYASPAPEEEVWHRHPPEYLFRRADYVPLPLTRLVRSRANLGDAFAMPEAFVGCTSLDGPACPAALGLVPEFEGVLSEGQLDAKLFSQTFAEIVLAANGEGMDGVTAFVQGSHEARDAVAHLLESDAFLELLLNAKNLVGAGVKRLAAHESDEDQAQEEEDTEYDADEDEDEKDADGHENAAMSEMLSLLGELRATISRRGDADAERLMQQLIAKAEQTLNGDGHGDGDEADANAEDGQRVLMLREMHKLSGDLREMRELESLLEHANAENAHSRNEEEWEEEEEEREHEHDAATTNILEKDEL